jgi:hypothetical protein
MLLVLGWDDRGLCEEAEGGCGRVCEDDADWGVYCSEEGTKAGGSSVRIARISNLSVGLRDVEVLSVRIESTDSARPFEGEEVGRVASLEEMSGVGASDTDTAALSELTDATFVEFVSSIFSTTGCTACAVPDCDFVSSLNCCSCCSCCSGFSSTG